MNFKDYLLEGMADEKNFTSNVQILRLAIQAELDAINLYEQLSTKTTNSKVRKLLLDIAFEEKVHVEELTEFLEDLDPEIESAEDKAEEELEDMGITE